MDRLVRRIAALLVVFFLPLQGLAASSGAASDDPREVRLFEAPGMWNAAMVAAWTGDTAALEGETSETEEVVRSTAKLIRAPACVPLIASQVRVPAARWDVRAYLGRINPTALARGPPARV